MELGEHIRQERLRLGLSQRQLCENLITRNMLSLIENGSARPSMDTLQQLARRLGKPISFFLEEDSAPSPNRQRMEQARAACPREALDILKDYEPGDPVYDWEKDLLEALCALDLAEGAIREGKVPYALTLLEQARAAGSRTPYYRPETERRRLLLLARADPGQLSRIADALPDPDPELLLRAEASLEKKDFPGCVRLLLACRAESPRQQLLLGLASMEEKDFPAAEGYLKKGLSADPKKAMEALEICCREQGDYKGAYDWACKRR